MPPPTVDETVFNYFKELFLKVIPIEGEPVLKSMEGDPLGEADAPGEDGPVYYREVRKSSGDIKFLEGDSVYIIHGPGGYRLDYSDLNFAHIRISEQSPLVRWAIGKKLSEIPREGLVVSGEDYLWRRPSGWVPFEVAFHHVHAH